MLDDSDNVSVCCLLDLVDNTYTYRKHYVGICHDDEQTKIKKCASRLMILLSHLVFIRYLTRFFLLSTEFIRLGVISTYIKLFTLLQMQTPIFQLRYSFLKSGSLCDIFHNSKKIFQYSFISSLLVTKICVI